MRKKLQIRTFFYVLTLLSLFLYGCTEAPVDCGRALDAIMMPNQTSASLLMKYAKLAAQCAPEGETRIEEKRLILIYDIYIKARSYTILNKLFFWLSLAGAIGVFLWPSLGVLLKERLQNRQWYKSAIVQTTITGIAALTFAFYSQYKNKQIYTENLMRYAIFSNEAVDVLSEKVIAEMTKIDKGFSFSQTVKK